MFTGLVEAVGRVAAIEPIPGGLRLSLRTTLAGALSPGESVAVNGVCLTATAIDGDLMLADIGPETVRVTALGDLRVDQPVNLERSLRADGRFGGHFVQGHVDGTGVVEAVRAEGDAWWVSVGFPADLAAYLIPKGSIAVDGISLTVAGLRERQFDVMIIPFTWRHTNLSTWRPGDRVNLECDMVGKYVARAIALTLAHPPAAAPAKGLA